MRLLYFSRSYTIHDLRFLTSFRDHGIDVLYLTLTGDQAAAEELPDEVNAIRWVGSRIPYETEDDHAQRLSALRIILHNCAPDIVLAGPIQTCTRLVMETGFQPYVAMSWGSDLLVDAAPGQPGETVARDVLASAAAAFGDCRHVYNSFRRLSMLPDDRIVIFPWGIDTQKFHPTTVTAPYRTWAGWDNGTDVIISLRSWEPVYAVDTLVDAFAIVHEAIPTSRLVLAGDGSERDKIQELVAQYALHDVICMPGRLENDRLPVWLASADLYVSTALSDGTSISLLEAMGCGLPVITTQGYGNLEWIDDGVNGWLVPPRKPDHLAQTIVDALRAPDVRSQMGQRNRQIAIERATWDDNFPQLVTLLRKIATL